MGYLHTGFNIASHKLLCYALWATVVSFKWSYSAFKALVKLLPNTPVLNGFTFFLIGAEWPHQKNHG